MSDADAELSLIAQQQRQILDQMNSMRGDMTSLTAAVMRLDRPTTGLVQEGRAVRALEDRPISRGLKSDQER